MAITNNLKKQLDLPVWEWLRFAPVATSALSCTAVGEKQGERYIYYLVGTVFYRYDTISDSWQLLASPNTDILTTQSMRYSSYGGYRCQVLEYIDSTHIRISGINNGILNGYDLTVVAGNGRGQIKTVKTVSEAITHEQGVATAAAASSLSDSTKKWIPNQWNGYQCRVSFSTGTSQVRKILYNDTTTLYFSDVNYQHILPWSNVGFSAKSPFAIPIVTAGSQSHFVIESHIAETTTAFTTPLNTSSRLSFNTGVIWLVSSATASPFYTFQAYDVASDVWYNKTAHAGLISAALGTDVTIERTGEYGGIFTSGTATSGTSNTLVHTSQNMSVDVFTNYQIRIVGGTGIGQRRRILGNTADTFWVEYPWLITPDGTSLYEVYGNTDAIYLAGNGGSSLFQYLVESDIWVQGAPIGAAGVVCNLAAYAGLGWENIGLTSITRNAGGITAVNAVPTAAGSGYTVGDILTISTGGTNGKVIVTETGVNGAVTGIRLLASGLTYTTGTGRAVTGGTGTACTIEITSIGVVGRVVTAINHNFQIGDSITIAGAVEAAWNNTYTVLGVDSLTGLDITTTATTTAVAANVFTTSLLVDPSATWTINEHVGRLVQIIGPGFTTATGQTRRITANTATTLTLQSAVTTMVAGQTRYIIHEPMAFGKDSQFKASSLSNSGRATGGSTSTLIDTTKTWRGNQWAGYRFRIISGPGAGSEIAITSNTKNTLNYSVQGFTPTSATKYLIMDCYGLLTAATNTTNAVLTDTTKNWAVNQWAGKRIKITSGLGQGEERTITSNTNNALTISGVFTVAPDTSSTYTILGITPRSTGIQLSWIFGTENVAERGRHIWLPQGGGTTRWDRYDIVKESWEHGIQMTPQSELLSTGSYFSYDGKNKIYFTATTTGRVFSLDVNNFRVEAAGLTPYAHGVACLGNRMEIVTTEDGLKFLYVMRNTGQEMWRTLVFWE